MDDDQESRLDRVKKHLKENKQVYLVGAGCLATGYFLRPQVVNIVDVCNLKYKSPTTNVVVTNVIRRGHPGNIIRCIDTGEVFASQRRAAQALGIHPYELYRHLSGHLETAGGHIFENLGEAV